MYIFFGSKLHSYANYYLKKKKVGAMGPTRPHLVLLSLPNTCILLYHFILFEIIFFFFLYI